jgi:glyoxylase-like metal-dependent hydrolase (beta-lactamase superfamily II)
MPQLIAGQAIALSPRIQRVLAPNPGVMPGTGTNTYLVGKERVAVIDPGPIIDEHIKTVLQAGHDRIEWILITHTHPDHSPAAEVIKSKTGAPILAFGDPSGSNSPNALQPDRTLNHDECLQGEDFTLRAIHTPGHASNHLCYLLEEEEILFTGDQIMNGSTVVIAPPDGNMKAYLDSLELLKSYPIRTLAPGHGDMMDDPLGVINGLIEHRLNRERKVIHALQHLEPAMVEDLIPSVYDDVPSFLHPIAKYSLLAHLIKLEGEDRAIRTDNIWRWLDRN